MKPLVPITSKDFKYVNAANTDISKTFKRIIAAQKQVAASTNEFRASVSPEEVAALKAVLMHGMRRVK